jgi:hypothetical protein
MEEGFEEPDYSAEGDKATRTERSDEQNTVANAAPGKSDESKNIWDELDPSASNRQAPLAKDEKRA